MASNHNQTVKADMDAQFGTLNVRQLWAITKLAKLIRLRGRNNSAFNNAMNEIFPQARFRTVNKSRVSRLTGRPETYPGLEITDGTEVISGEEDGEE